MRSRAQDRCQERRSLRAAYLALMLLLISVPLSARAAEWPMLARDAGRSGTTPAEIRPAFERKWYRLFTDELARYLDIPWCRAGLFYIHRLIACL